MVFSILERAARQLSETILAEDAPRVAAIPAGFNGADAVGARNRLRGAILQSSAGPTFFLVPDVASSRTAASKMLSVSEAGDAASATEKSEAQVNALAIDRYILDVLRVSGSSDAIQLTVGGLSDGAAVSIAPIIASPWTQVTATVGMGAPQPIDIAQVPTLVGKEWLPWAGALEQPPTLPVETGLLDLATADAATVAADALLGVGPARAMREASLQLVLHAPPTRCGHMAALVSSIINRDVQRPLAIALASVQAAPDPADGPRLIAARAATPAFLAALTAAIDAITPHHTNIITANNNLRAMGITVGFIEAGRHIGQALKAAELASPAPAPPPAPPPASTLVVSGGGGTLTPVVDPAVAAAIAGD